MSPVSHQTVRLEAGNDASPDLGMCVLELASVLAGDTFSAYPASVCPVPAAFLRCHNDLVDDRRRQDLIACAAAVVGSRAGKRIETRRARLCRRWVSEVARPGFWSHPFWVGRDQRSRPGLWRVADGVVPVSSGRALSWGDVGPATERLVEIILGELVSARDAKRLAAPFATQVLAELPLGGFRSIRQIRRRSAWTGST